MIINSFLIGQLGVQNIWNHHYKKSSQTYSSKYGSAHFTQSLCCFTIVQYIRAREHIFIESFIQQCQSKCIQPTTLIHRFRPSTNTKHSFCIHITFGTKPHWNNQFLSHFCCCCCCVLHELLLNVIVLSVKMITVCTCRVFFFFFGQSQ